MPKMDLLQVWKLALKKGGGKSALPSYWEPWRCQRSNAWRFWAKAPRVFHRRNGGNWKNAGNATNGISPIVQTGLEFIKL